ncbi:MAG: modification methylase [Epulopiscium sp. Nele67-Bin004]|nr:MAG: modification methylase [Epulopiscium sp. Nele67-Bin004]
MNYIGSKYSLISFLTETIDSVTNIRDGKGYTFADLFSGTGIVGTTFKQKGYSIISNDIQHYSYILSKHNIENNDYINTHHLDFLNDLDGIDGFIYKNYCLGSGSERNYFSDYNGRKCDAIRMQLDILLETNQIDCHQYNFYLASLINSIDKHANTASVYGAFLKHIKKSATKNFQLELLPIIIGGIDGKAYNQDIKSLITKINGDILYLDPPYNARQYCANYHILETISRYDNPIIKGKTGLRDYSLQKSAFCSKKTVATEFEYIIKNANFKYIFVSYNNEGLMSLETIAEIMSKYGEYKFFTKEYRRFKADKTENRNHKTDHTLEYLHCIIKNTN